MGNSHSTRTIRFHVNSRAISGNFILTFEPRIIYRIEDAIDDFILVRKRKIQKDNLCIEKTNGTYEINVNGFIAICNIIFRVLKEYS